MQKPMQASNVLDFQGSQTKLIAMQLLSKGKLFIFFS